jgi:uncharacterized protein (TIGR03546 family)
MVRMIAKLLKVLNSEAAPGQISLALCFSLFIGLTPLMSPHNLLILLLAFCLRVNLSAFLLGGLFFSGIAYILDPLFHTIGYQILTAGSMNALWTALYDITLFRIGNFNNSIVMGSLLFSLIAFIPLYFLSNMLIVRYRKHILAWVEKTRLAQALKASRLYTVYQTISGLGGA